jgi:hypothetical protein
MAMTEVSIMYRAAIERERTLRKWRAHHTIVHEWDLGGPDAYYEIQHCICEFQPNRFRKSEPIAGRCQNKHCSHCYGKYDEKRMKVATHRQRKEDLRFKHSMEDEDLLLKWYYKSKTSRWREV